MAEFINQIPGYEKGRVQRINATDEVSESFIVAQMAADLQRSGTPPSSASPWTATKRPSNP